MQPATADKKEPRKGDALKVMTLLLQGVVFGSLYGWLLQKRQGVRTPELRKYLGVASTVLPFLMIDKDCCTFKLNESHFALLSIHFVLSLRSWLERSFQSFGPWSGVDGEASDLALTVAFVTHLGSFIHMLTKEAGGSLAKKLAALASFMLGANLTTL